MDPPWASGPWDSGYYETERNEAMNETTKQIATKYADLIMQDNASKSASVPTQFARVHAAIIEATENLTRERDALQATVEKCGAAGFIDEKGEVMKADGVLPALADGTLCGGKSDQFKIERLWAVQPTSKEVFECHRYSFWSELDDWRVSLVESDRIVPLSWCYSTKAAARQAAERAKGGGDA